MNLAQWLTSQSNFLLQQTRSLAATDREITAEATDMDMVRILWTAPIMGIVHLLTALGYWLKKPAGMSEEIIWHQWVLGINLLMAIICMAAMLGARYIRKTRPSYQIKTLFLYTVVTYVLVAGLLLAIIDQLVIPSVSPLIISIVIVGTFYYVPPRNSFLIFGVLLWCFRFFFINFTNNTENILASNLTNGAVAIFVGFSLSLINWQHFRKLKVQQGTIVRQQKLLEQMAYQDALTELPNRRWLDELIKTEVALIQRNQGEACLAILDIDNFKGINDTYGHPVGDALLRDFAQLLRKNLRESNTLIRLGGEEFIVLARNTSLEECAILAERLRAETAEHVFKIGCHSIQITASFGVAQLLGVEHTKNYYASADKALYRAKQCGKNKVVVFEHQGKG